MLSSKGQNARLPQEARGPIHLRGQEFLEFRRVSSHDDVDVFVHRFGALGVELASIRPLDEDPPLWERLLSEESAQSKQGIEPVADWIRQAGLIRLAVGAIAVAQSEEARTWLADLREGSLNLPAELPWQVNELVSGAERAGLTHRSYRYSSHTRGDVGYPAHGFEAENGGVSLFVQDESGEAFYAGVAQLVEPWLKSTQLYPWVNEWGLRIAPTPLLTFLDALWLQVAYAATAHFPLRRCHWGKCRRLGVFMWRAERALWDIKHRESEYCSQACESAARSKRWRDGTKLTCLDCGATLANYGGPRRYCDPCQKKRRARRKR